MASPALRLYKADVVHLKVGRDDEHKVGMVSRCYQDELDANPNSFAEQGLDRALKENEYGVLWYPSGERQIVSSSDLILIDRIFSVGSNCKRSLGAAASGVVVSTSNVLKLQHLFSREEIEYTVPADDVVKSNYLNHGDLVIANDWIGEIDGVVEEAMVGNPDNDRLIRVCEMGGRLLLGRIPKEHMDENEIAINLMQLGISEASIVDIKQTVLYVNWLALNQKLSPEQQAQRPKPPALWTDYSKLTLVKSFAERNHEIGDRVVFKTPELKQKYGAKVTYHGAEQIPVDVMLIIETRTELEVLWQDGSRTKEMAADMVPHVNLDENEAWPGDWVNWKSDEQGSVPRIVQSMDVMERTAELRKPLSDPAEIELVPSLEIDVYGADHTVFSLHRGDSVMLSERPTGWTGPFIPTVGDPRRDYTDYKMQNDLMNAEMTVVAQHGYEINQRPKTGAEATEIDWFGTVDDILLDGTCRIRLPCGKMVVEKLDKLQILSDSTYSMHEHEHLEEVGNDPWGQNPLEYDDEDMYDDDDFDMDAGPWMDQNGIVIPGNVRDDWEDMSEGTPEVSAVHPPESAPEVAEIHLDEADVAAVDAMLTPLEDTKVAKESAPAASTGVENKDAEASTSAPVELASASSDAEWNQFAVLESAPQSHAFYSKPLTAQPSGAFFKRLQKEMKVLQSSLPETILVRAYEDRSDLLRVLIIGSQGTPYEDAPFLLDFQLTSEFPNEPPKAHFHSWTNGHGRVSPNLYEDGKVCLSILGTWSGVAEENWTPSQSSLLQVFVSIQALVLVKEPYFTEPAFEKLKGKEESRLNSRAYSEKAYILSRGFVKTVLEKRPEGFETEVGLFYYKAGNLSKVIERAEKLINSEAQEGRAEKEKEEEAAVNGMSKGGAIMLGRTLKSLHTLLEAEVGTKPKA